MHCTLLSTAPVGSAHLIELSSPSLSFHIGQVGPERKEQAVKIFPGVPVQEAVSLNFSENEGVISKCGLWTMG